FHELLEDDDAFAQAVAEIPGSKKEGVWQNFFEANPWILGLSLNGQLLTSWDDEKLEKIVAGRTVAGVGKRADALLATSGRIRSMVFAEFKTHQTPLLSTEYRDGCWAPSTHVSGGVSQAQGTIHRASTAIGERLALLDKDGAERLGEFGYLLRPKSYLVVGRLDEFVGASGGHHVDKVRSFELYRRQLVDPEIATFDELLARADWLVAS
ncbi:Shedu immune nuclease family protein, partial [uncultured Jatrophihabitans sp.]|uniref:Shedu immune nuclease family protein n=1 Tax=uncultured Jatrophihabitans sp. TaxID=1610747 RepID=UPI0035CB3C82